MGVAYVRRFSLIQGTCRYKIFECAVYGLGVLGKETLASIEVECQILLSR